jgi:hypothetical protein
MTSRRLWILEGPDGSGKSMLAAELARDGARVIHCGPFARITHGLGRLYLEAMLPALQGFTDVVLDRSWLSEPIYADAFRHGHRRLAPADLRMLERVAARCRTVVVRCLPPLGTCLTSYRGRRVSEYLQREEQLAAVWRAYAAGMKTTLPVVDYDYTAPHGLHWIDAVVTTTAHPLKVASAGYLTAPVLLVGEAFSDVGEYDCLQQYPFVSFGSSGCATWLADQLAVVGLMENQLLWVNADGGLAELAAVARPRLVVALGERAAKAVDDRGFSAGTHVATVQHPQYHKRFRFNKPYPLLDVIKEGLSAPGAHSIPRMGPRDVTPSEIEAAMREAKEGLK